MRISVSPSETYRLIVFIRSAPQHRQLVNALPPQDLLQDPEHRDPEHLNAERRKAAGDVADAEEDLDRQVIGRLKRQHRRNRAQPVRVKPERDERARKQHIEEVHKPVQDKTIAIYLDDAKLVCYHNIDNFENETNVEAIFLYQGSTELMNIVKNNRAFENVSKICLSNSMYSLEDGVSTHRSISKIALNVNSLKTLKNIFYKKKCRNVSSCAGGYYEFQDILCNVKSVNEFQQILDILYLQYIKEQNIKSVFAHNIVGNLEIKFQTFKHCLDEKFDDFAGELCEYCGG